LKKNYNSISIRENLSLLDAIKQMDVLDGKLLMVVDDKNNYVSIISIGDIQRYLIAHQNIEAKVVDALRKNVRVASTKDSLEQIKNIMLEFRTEFMPVLDNQGKLDRVIFWKDIFKSKLDSNKKKINVPVVIMAGGKGTRLKPITNIIPKPLVPIGEKPIVQIIMDQFSEMGAENFYMSVNYKSEMIQQYLDKIDKPYSITYFEEEKPLGTAGSLFLVKDQIKDTFFVSNCDILIDQDYEEVYKWHKENKNEITSIAAIKNYHIPYGTLEIGKDGLLESMKEKPDLTFFVNAGVYVVEPHLLYEVPKNEFYHITHLMEKVKKRGGRVGVFPVSEGSWMDIGNWVEYNKTQETFKKRFNRL
jgi:dTDP-glucose pyrophosphorylase